LKCAIPYFETTNHPIADKAEKSFLTAVWPSNGNRNKLIF
jgi:hypothetical protein